mgnify:CR=1 FL=1
MVLDDIACHTAVRSRDRRFDGVFYTGVKTTGVYCRPVCPAKTPLAKNCAFFATPAQAEAAGFRPCLRCRPEMSPGRRVTTAPNDNLAERFLAQVQNDGLFGETLETVAYRLGVSSRHLRRVVEQQCGVGPHELVRSTRLLFARRLLSTTSMSVATIAYGAGFGSLSRFNEGFRERYSMTPSEFRERASIQEDDRAAITLRIAAREPLAWSDMLEYLGLRCIPGVEAVRDGKYWRTLRIGRHKGWLSVARTQSGAVELEVSGGLAGPLIAVAGRVRNLFDLDTNPEPIAETLVADELLQPAVEGIPGLRIPGTCDGFELAVRAILGQQVTVRAATTLAGRMVQRFSEPAHDVPEGLSHWPLDPASIANAELGDIAACGIPSARAATIKTLAMQVANGHLDLDHTVGSQQVLRTLEAIPGIGPWTRDYIAMRALRQPDAFPAGDLGLRKAAGHITSAELERRSERWRPWRPYAAIYLWNLERMEHTNR